VNEDLTCAIWDDEPERLSIEEERARAAVEDAQDAHDERISRMLFERFGAHFDRRGNVVIPFKVY
jgi:hypothetical protein